MPIMHLNTTLQDKDINKDFDLALCEKVGQILNKPIEKITLTIHTGKRQMRAGSADPMASLDIHSIGVFDKDKSPTYIPTLLEFLSQKLKLPENRVVVIFHDLQPYNLG
ncbi:D-dopachrome decarboxylase-like [Babylonia areolata]|uniref:D-dopachrome decarboxylase-like n=1 Tax=Babylonia areolata TaxID=304850 RepID=UPI003FD3AF43